MEDGLGEPACEFFGLKIGKDEAVKIEPVMDAESFEVIHITQLALGPDPKKGGHTVFVRGEGEGEEIAVGTLDRERSTQFAVDFSVGTSAVFVSHSGPSDIYLSGYRVVSFQPPGSDDELESSEEEESEEESEDEDEEAPEGIPLVLTNGARKSVDRGAKGAGAGGEEDDESSDDGESDDSGSDDDSDGDDGPGLPGMSDEDSSGSEVSESGEEGSSSDSDDVSSDDEDDEGAGPPEAAPRKRGREAPAPSPSGKKRREQAGSASEDPLRAYVRALARHLRASGPQPLSSLGSAVKRPSDAPKLRAVLDAFPERFQLDKSTGLVRGV